MDARQALVELVRGRHLARDEGVVQLEDPRRHDLGRHREPDAGRHSREQDRRDLQHELALLGRRVALQDLEHLRETGRALVGLVVMHLVHLRPQHRPADPNPPSRAKSSGRTARILRPQAGHAMRFEISYQGGTTHEVELPGHLCVVGRDPGCDIVLNDAKCSRRHAVIEETPEGVAVRDSGSANGIYVNGKKVESSPLRPGDTLRMGEVKLRLLPEIGETVIVGPEGLSFDVSVSGPTQLGGDTGEQPVPEAPPPPPRPLPRLPRRLLARIRGPLRREPGHSPRPAARPPPLAGASREPREARHARHPARPATVTLLAGLWALFVPLAVAGVLMARGTAVRRSRRLGSGRRPRR